MSSNLRSDDCKDVLMEEYQVLECMWEGMSGTKNNVSCSSGTAALHLALESLPIQLGSIVIVPDFTMIAVARAVVMAGMVPLFLDCDHTFNIDPARIDEALNSGLADRIEGVIAVHTYGRPCNMDLIEHVIRKSKREIFLVEDLAEAHGLRPHDRTDAACWSFYKNKIIAGEEGGIVSFQEEDFASKARSLKSLGFTEEHDFQHIPRGHNYRLANCLADKIITSLEYYIRNNRNGDLPERRQIETWYDQCCPINWRLPKRYAMWVYDLMIPGIDSTTQDYLVKELKSQGIKARHAFKPMLSQVEFDLIDYGQEEEEDPYEGTQWEGTQTEKKKETYEDVSSISRAEIVSREVIYLPVDPKNMVKQDCEKALRIIKEIMKYEEN